MLIGFIVGILSVIVIALAIIAASKPIIYNTNSQLSLMGINTDKDRIFAAIDSTPVVEELGIPFSTSGYARNVWDMQVFNGRIYLGHGNSRNSGPNPNAGPIPIIYYDPIKGKFISQITVDEEQIETYRIIDSELYIPGRDPRDSSRLGNFYRLEGDSWSKQRTIPNAIHTFDMVYKNGKIFAAIGTQLQSPTVLVSHDNGETWANVIPTSGEPYLAFEGRTYTLFNFNNSIYAFSIVLNMNIDPYNRVLVVDGSKYYTEKVRKNSMLPGAPEKTLFQLTRPTAALNHMIYISVKYDSTYQLIPEGLYYAPKLNQAKRAVLPETGVLPTDILSREDLVYVLAYKKTASKEYTNIVYKTTNLSQWTEVVRFKNETFARSFEELDGDFYFGMGCNADDISTSTGKILRIKACAYETIQKINNHFILASN